MTPSIKQIDEAISELSSASDITVDYKPTNNLLPSIKIALSILQHVKQHGLAIGEEEIEKVIRDSWDSMCPTPKQFATAIAERTLLK